MLQRYYYEKFPLNFSFTNRGGNGHHNGANSRRKDQNLSRTGNVGLDNSSKSDFSTCKLFNNDFFNVANHGPQHRPSLDLLNHRIYQTMTNAKSIDDEDSHVRTSSISSCSIAGTGPVIGNRFQSEKDNSQHVKVSPAFSAIFTSLSNSVS